MDINELQNLNTGMVYWRDGFGIDFSLHDLVKDWVALRHGPFQGDMERNVEKIFFELHKSIPKAR